MKKDKIIVQIKSKEDEIKWKAFLRKYFPNHYASSILDKDLVIDIDAYRSGRGYQSKTIGVAIDGFGYISMRLAHYGNYYEVNDFIEFMDTSCYQIIIKNGPSYSEGTPEIIKIKM